MHFLHYCLSQLNIEEECRIREANSEITPEKVYDIVYALTGDKDLAAKREAWQWLENPNI